MPASVAGESYLRRKVLNRWRRRPRSQASQDGEEAPRGGGLRSLGASQESSESRRSAYARLRTASRALLAFGRSASPGAGRHTATNSHLLGAGPNAGASSSAASSSAGSTAAGGPLPGARQPSTQSQPPKPPPPPPTDRKPPPDTQFIVPKVSALKLPLVCLIRSLDGQLMREVFVHRYERGQYLIEALKVSVGLADSKYFGLRLASPTPSAAPPETNQQHGDDPRSLWLNLNESVCKQLKGKLRGPAGSRQVDLYLRVKFYPPSVARVQDQFLRNYLWLQLRRDLSLGKLTSSMNNLTLLMACVLQYELGDYEPHLAERAHQLAILPNQDLIEEQALEVWRGPRLRGARRHQVQMQFLRTAMILETYGFDYYSVRDHQRQRAYLLGFNYAGLKTVRNGRIVHHFTWHSMSKISQERRMIIFHIHPTEVSKRKQILGFKCLSDQDCQSLYMRLLEQKYFFTVDLAYFDKSFPRPACLYGEAGAAAATVAGDELAAPEVGPAPLSRATSAASSAGYPPPPAPLGPAECGDPRCPCVSGPIASHTPPPCLDTCQPGSGGWPAAPGAPRAALQRQQATFRRGSSLEEAGSPLDEAAILSDDEREPPPPSPPSGVASNRSTHNGTWNPPHRRWARTLLEFVALVLGLNVLLKCTDFLSSGLLALLAHLLLAAPRDESTSTA